MVIQAFSSKEILFNQKGQRAIVLGLMSRLNALLIDWKKTNISNARKKTGTDKKRFGC